jgi:hypothetical protein
MAVSPIAEAAARLAPIPPPPHRGDYRLDQVNYLTCAVHFGLSIVFLAAAMMDQPRASRVFVLPVALGLCGYILIRTGARQFLLGLRRESPFSFGLLFLIMYAFVARRSLAAASRAEVAPVALSYHGGGITWFRR